MKYRKLRIAWSVAWGALGLLLVLLWVRSFSQMYSLEFAVSDTRVFEVLLFKGATTASRVDDRTPMVQRVKVGAIEAFPMLAMEGPSRVGGTNVVDAFAGIGFKRTRWGTVKGEEDGFGVVWPHWFVLVLVLAIGIAPQLLWRFSLRRLLVAMTLVAVVLGAAVHATK